MARPGIVIGKSGSEVDALARSFHKTTGKAVKVNILEIKDLELMPGSSRSRSPSSCRTASPSGAR